MPKITLYSRSALSLDSKIWLFELSVKASSPSLTHLQANIIKNQITMTLVDKLYNFEAEVVSTIAPDTPFPINTSFRWFLKFHLMHFKISLI